MTPSNRFVISISAWNNDNVYLVMSLYVAACLVFDI